MRIRGSRDRMHTIGGVAESIRVIGNYLEMVDSVERGRDGWTLDKGEMDSTKRTWRE